MWLDVAHLGRAYQPFCNTCSAVGSRSNAGTYMYDPK